MSIIANYQQQHVWREKYLAIIGGFLAVFQLLLSLTVEGCELYGDFIHFPRMNIFIGHAAFPMFTCAWISLAAASMCDLNLMESSFVLFLQVVAVEFVVVQQQQLFFRL